MIYKGFSVWIESFDGDKLPEYREKVMEDNVIECWIPSTEGQNFKIRYDSSGVRKKRLDLCAYPYLDGVSVTGMVMRVDKQGQGLGSIDKQRTSSSTARYLSFGTRTLTDREEVASSKAKLPKDLNCIRVRMEWGSAGEIALKTSFYVPEENGPIHEKVAKKGHAGAAGFGKSFNCASSPTSVAWVIDKRAKSVEFVFHYAREDWLQAREIIPTENTQKRARSTTPELIDIDELETDDDEITIVKHMIPAPLARTQKNKRRKIHVKEEEQDEEQEDEEEGSEEEGDKEENVKPEPE